MKLPKQWENWCRDQHLSVHGRRYGKKRRDWCYLKGRGHYWRVNCYGMLERGDTYADFDRWALCTIEEVPMPKSRDEFREAVGTLLARKQGAKHDNH